MKLSLLPPIACYPVQLLPSAPPLLCHWALHFKIPAPQTSDIIFCIQYGQNFLSLIYCVVSFQDPIFCFMSVFGMWLWIADSPFTWPDAVTGWAMHHCCISKWKLWGPSQVPIHVLECTLVSWLGHSCMVSLNFWRSLENICICWKNQSKMFHSTSVPSCTKVDGLLQRSLIPTVYISPV